MEFTYKEYEQLINKLKELGYKTCNYQETMEEDKYVILRHDVDFSLDKALEFAFLEKRQQVSSTYFILISSDFYNIFSKESYKKIITIREMGHTIGLHFDEQRYENSSVSELKKHVSFELDVLNNYLNIPINVISMHRPSEMFLKSNISFENIINSYSSEFFTNIKYLSDSRMEWKEDIFKILDMEKHDKLHILTHPFWYSNEPESIDYKINAFIKSAGNERYISLKNNFKNLEEIISET